MIHLKHISKTFGTGSSRVDAVRDVSLDIEDGEIFGVIGFSGAGKSTLVRCINLLERPTAGAVTVNGQELTALNARELRQARRRIGMIFQHFNLLASRTVSENIAYPLRSSGASKTEIVARVQELLKLVDMEDKAGAYPSQLSGGQKQRVAIARALANRPSVLLCDEATSALDPQTTHSILQLLQRLNRELGITVVLITHQMNVVKEICGRVAVMENGRIVEQGDVFSIFSEPRQEITKEFIQTTSNLNRIGELLAADSPVARLRDSEKIVRLTYREKSVSEAMVSSVSRDFQVDVNIIFGQIEMIQNAPLGGIVAIVGGTASQVDAALEYFREKHVKVEVIADAASGNADSKRPG